MIELIINHYKTELDTFNKANSFYNLWFGIDFVLFILSFLSLIINDNLLNNKYILQTFLLILVSVIWFFILLKKRDKKWTKIIQDKYNIKACNSNNVGDLARELQVNQMICFLEKLNLKNESNIREIINQINKKVESKKLPSIFIPGVFGALFYPIWSQFTKKVLDLDCDVDTSFKTLWIFLIVIFFIVIFIGVIKMMTSDVKKFFIETDNQKLISLIKILEDILLRL